MSLLKVNAIVNAAGANTATLNGALPVLDTAPGLAKAWVNFNGTGTVAIRSALNVSSITDVTTGRYLVNFTTAMADANYCANVTSTRATGWAGCVDTTSVSPTTTVLAVATTNHNGNSDSLYVCVSIFD